MRLCRRRAHLSRPRASVSCAPSGGGAPRAPYEEVVSYQRRPSDKHRLVVLVGASLRAVSLLVRGDDFLLDSIVVRWE